MLSGYCFCYFLGLIIFNVRRIFHCNIEKVYELNTLKFSTFSMERTLVSTTVVAKQILHPILGIYISFSFELIFL